MQRTLLPPSNTAYMTFEKSKRLMALKLEQEHKLATQEITSGGKTTDYTDVSDVALFVDLEVALEGNRKYKDGDNYNMNRMQTMAKEITKLREIANNLQQQISETRSMTGTPTANLINMAQGMKSHVENMLNATFGKEYLFSGTATLTESVGDIDDSGVTIGGWTTAYHERYYRGNQDPIVFNADETTEVATRLNASHAGISQLIYAINLCVYSGGSADVLESLGYANDLCNQASQDMVSADTDLQRQMKALKEAQDNLLLQGNDLEASIKETGYKTPSDALQNYMDTRTSLEIAQAIISKNDYLRNLVDRL